MKAELFDFSEYQRYFTEYQATRYRKIVLDHFIRQYRKLNAQPLTAIQLILNDLKLSPSTNTAVRRAYYRLTERDQLIVIQTFLELIEPSTDQPA